MKKKLIRIIAKSPAGETALRKHLEDWDKPSPERQREMMVMEKLGISQHIISEDPLTVEVHFEKLSGQKKVKLFQMVHEIDKTMKENGAARYNDTPDYDVECEE